MKTPDYPGKSSMEYIRAIELLNIHEPIVTLCACISLSQQRQANAPVHHP